MTLDDSCLSVRRRRETMTSRGAADMALGLVTAGLAGDLSTPQITHYREGELKHLNRLMVILMVIMFGT